MTVQELIDKLERIKYKHGNLDVVITARGATIDLQYLDTVNEWYRHDKKRPTFVELY